QGAFRCLCFFWLGDGDSPTGLVSAARTRTFVGAATSPARAALAEFLEAELGRPLLCARTLVCGRRAPLSRGQLPLGQGLGRRGLFFGCLGRRRGRRRGDRSRWRWWRFHDH